MAPQDRSFAFDAIAVVTILILTIVAYAEVSNHEFVGIDDPVYILENTTIHDGLSPEVVSWALTTGHAGNWHPLTWISHAIDFHFFDLDSGAHHLTNLALHCLNTLLLFIVLRWMTGQRWASAFVAAVFALHPLHVESVAWVSERKDVLSTFFWMLTMLAYTWYVKSGGGWRYALVMIVFALGLMAKPMLVTLPVVLLLLDYWPLKRYMPEFNSPWQTLYLAAEKVPLLVLSAICSVLTVKMQSAGAAVASVKVWPLPYRLGNASIACVTYLRDMFWPSNLCYFYPIHEIDWVSPWQWVLALSALLVLIGLTLVALLVVRKAPYVTVGWLWYLITLIPVMGIVQVGQQSHADRYMYIPMVGLAMGLAWIGVALAKRSVTMRRVVLVVGIAVIAVSVPLTRKQVLTWRDSETLFTRAIDVTARNYRAHTGLGNVYQQQDRLDEAINHYKIALGYNPFNALANHRLGVAYAVQSEWYDADAALTRSLASRPEQLQTRIVLARVLDRQRKFVDASKQYGIVMALPGGEAQFGDEAREFAQDLAAAENRLKLAAEQLSTNPNSADLRYKFAWALYNRGYFKEAEREARIASSTRSGWDTPRLLIATLLRLDGRYEGAIEAYLRILKRSPRNEAAQQGLLQLVGFLCQHPEIEVKQDVLQTAAHRVLEREAESYEAHWMLGRCYAEANDPRQAIDHLRQALQHQGNDPIIAAELALVLSTTKEKELRDGPEALRLALAACEELDYTNILCLKALAAAQTELGNIAEARKTLETAARFAKLHRDAKQEREIQRRLDRLAHR